MKYLIAFYIWLVSAIYFLWFAMVFIVRLRKHGPEKVFKKFEGALQRFFKLIFVKVTVIEEEKIDVSKTYVYMPNHVSFIDAFLFGAYLPTCGNAIEADRNFKWPIYGKLITAYEQIPIDRNNVRSSIKTFQVAKERIQKGRSIVVFPEGHRSLTGYLEKFKKLPFVFAKDCGADIIPVGVTGMQKLSPKGSFVIRPAKITIKFGKPIKAEDAKNMKVEELMALVRKRVIDLVDDYTEEEQLEFEKKHEKNNDIKL